MLLPPVLFWLLLLCEPGWGSGSLSTPVTVGICALGFCFVPEGWKQVPETPYADWSVWNLAYIMVPAMMEMPSPLFLTQHLDFNKCQNWISY